MAVQMLERPAQTPPALRMTYEEFLDWLTDDVHAEWVNGEVVMHSPVTRRHIQVHKLLLEVIDLFLQAKDLGELAFDPFQMKTAADLPGRAPDILVVTNEHLDRFEENLLAGPADLAVEVVSPGSRGRDRGDKYYEYEQGGVLEYWLVDPEREVAEFHILQPNGRYEMAPVGGDGVFRSRVLPGLWIRVGWLWQRPLPKTLDVLRQIGVL